MALESGTYIDDLVATNPNGGDAKSDGDNHLRLIKSTIVNSFPNISGAVTANQSELNLLDGLVSLSYVARDATSLPILDNVYDIGSTDYKYANIWATTFQGQATSAQYADLAEKYLSDKLYGPGTVVMFGGSHEITKASENTTKIAGVISTNPAFLMNSGLTGAHVLPVALRGRVPCKVTGPVDQGDLLVSNGDGTAKVDNYANANAVIGRSLESKPKNVVGVIEMVVS